MSRPSSRLPGIPPPASRMLTNTCMCSHVMLLFMGAGGTRSRWCMHEAKRQRALLVSGLLKMVPSMENTPRTNIRVRCTTESGWCSQLQSQEQVGSAHSGTGYCMATCRACASGTLTYLLSMRRHELLVARTACRQAVMLLQLAKLRLW